MDNFWLLAMPMVQFGFLTPKMVSPSEPFGTALGLTGSV